MEVLDSAYRMQHFCVRDEQSQWIISQLIEKKSVSAWAERLGQVWNHSAYFVMIHTFRSVFLLAYTVLLIFYS